jgi:hypothetical protein
MRPAKSILIALGLLLVECPAVDRVLAGGGPLPAVTCLDQLASLSWCELTELYRQSAPGTITDGFARGRVVYCPAEHLSHVRGRLASTLWRGKHFCTAEATLVNQWLGLRAIRARFSYGPGWLDGKPSIILDYGGESRVWADVRDEMREVAPGLYVGLMYLRTCAEPRLKLIFCLEAQSCPVGRRVSHTGSP